ncbi:MAG: NlpC/P60 family protein [Hyphomicrobiaceae bacterium]
MPVPGMPPRARVAAIARSEVAQTARSEVAQTARSEIAQTARSEIVALARAWIGTPYRHQASLRGVGTDCLGLVRGVWRELYGAEPAAIPGYARDWGDASGCESLLEGARAHFTEIAPADARPGDLLLFRWRRDCVAKHAAILATPVTMIHAVEGRRVVEVHVVAWWRRRIAAAFAFPALPGLDT